MLSVPAFQLGQIPGPEQAAPNCQVGRQCVLGDLPDTSFYGVTI